jgi:hypothetical protein
MADTKRLLSHQDELLGAYRDAITDFLHFS